MKNILSYCAENYGEKIAVWFKRKGEVLNYKIDIHAMCSILFTSGATGDSKGVMLSHNSLIKDAIHTRQNLYLQEGTVAALPLCHFFGFTACILVQFITGGKVYLNSSLKRAKKDIKFAAPGHISAVPMLVRAIYNGIWESTENRGVDKQLKLLILKARCLN